MNQCHWCKVSAVCFFADNQYLCRECLQHWQLQDDVAIFHMKKYNEEMKANYAPACAAAKERKTPQRTRRYDERRPLIPQVGSNDNLYLKLVSGRI